MIPPCPSFCSYSSIKVKELKPLMEAGMAKADILQANTAERFQKTFHPILFFSLLFEYLPYLPTLNVFASLSPPICHFIYRVLMIVLDSLYLTFWKRYLISHCNLCSSWLDLLLNLLFLLFPLPPFIMPNSL